MTTKYEALQMALDAQNGCPWIAAKTQGEIENG